jgi:hypothetical protein
LWHEYPIRADFERQKEIIRNLRALIQALERENLIVGYAFDHYFNIPNEPNELRIRFQYSDEQNRREVESQLEASVRRLHPNYVLEERAWGSDTTDRHVLQAYEFGSRCAFLFWELLSQGRFPENYTSNFIRVVGQQFAIVKIPFEFQYHFNHGVMNSLGVPKIRQEQWIHMQALLESTGCKSPTALYKWLKKQPAGFFPRKKVTRTSRTDRHSPT